MKKEIVIYGAGKYGKVLKNTLAELGVEVSCFLETEVIGVNEYNGVPIMPIDSLSTNQNENIIILLAISNREVCQEVRLSLYRYGIRNKQIIRCADYIKNVLHKNFCVFCDEYVDFEPGGEVKGYVFEKYHIIGGGYRENCKCINCKSIDRERWLYYVLKRHTKIFEEECSILHFAPEKNVSKQIALQNAASRYVKADIAYRRADYVVDMTNIEFEDNSFDYIIANHVLEHIEDEKKAISELKRVLKPNGTLIISFPICADFDTLEDKSIITKEDRLTAYGQEDHVRLYGKDYQDRLGNYGLKIKVFSPFKELGAEEISELGFIYDDIILMCSSIG